MDDFLRNKYRRTKRMRSNSLTAQVLRTIKESDVALTATMVADKTGIKGNYVRSLLSRMTSSDPTFKCEYGQMPVIRLEEVALSETTNCYESLYTWNYRYGNKELN